MIHEHDRYLFDLRGYLVLRGVLTPGEVAELNRIADEHADEIEASAELRRQQAKLWLSELSWEERRRLLIERSRPERFMHWDAAFRNLVDHPRILPYLTAWIDPGVRVDHFYGIFSDGDTKKHDLHLGATPVARPAYYYVNSGRLYNGLTVVSWALADMPAGQGCFACVPGSHKANFPLTATIGDFSQNPDGVVAEIPMQAGDVVIFTEALTHGAYPWTAPHRRRSLLFKYSPGHQAWIHQDWPEDLLDLLTPQQRRMFEPPYVSSAQAAIDGRNDGQRPAVDDPNVMAMEY